MDGMVLKSIERGFIWTWAAPKTNFATAWMNGDTPKRADHFFFDSICRLWCPRNDWDCFLANHHTGRDSIHENRRSLKKTQKPRDSESKSQPRAHSSVDGMFLNSVGVSVRLSDQGGSGEAPNVPGWSFTRTRTDDRQRTLKTWSDWIAVIFRIFAWNRFTAVLPGYHDDSFVWSQEILVSMQNSPETIIVQLTIEQRMRWVMERMRLRVKCSQNNLSGRVFPNGAVRGSPRTGPFDTQKICIW
jgi:hypothetical protein